MKLISILIQRIRRWSQKRKYRKSVRMTDYIGTYLVPVTRYPELDGSEFGSCMASARQAVDDLNLGLDSGPVLDLIVLLKARQLFYQRILKQRNENHVCALSCRSAAIIQYRNQQALVDELEQSLADVEAELAALDAPGFGKHSPQTV